MKLSRTLMLSSAALAALVVAPIGAQDTRQVIAIGGGGQDVRVIREEMVAGMAAGRLAAMPMGTGVIVGQAIDEGGKQPVAGALVTLSLPGSQPIRALADAEGRFAFRDLPKGRFSLTVSKAGYVDGAYGRLRPSGPSQTLSLEDNDRDASIVIPLWRYGVITGTIIDENGEPAIGVTVRALKKSIVAGATKLTLGPIDTTDDRGTFRLSMLEPAEYVVAVPMTQSLGMMGIETIMAGGAAFTATFAGGGEPMILGMSDSASASAGVGEDGRALSYQTLFYPATTTSTRATVIPIGSGEERPGIDFQLKPVRTQKIAGRVMGPDGPAPRTTINLVPAETEGLTSPIEAAMTISDAAGEFIFPSIPPGQYSLQIVRPPQGAMRMGPETVTVMQGGGQMAVTRAVVAGPGALPAPPAEPTMWADVPMTVGNSDISEAVIVLRPGGRVRGEVQFSGSAERPTPEQLPSIAITLEPADGRMRGPMLRGRVEPNGTFSTGSVPPGKYFVRVGGVPQGWTFRGAMQAGRDLADVALELGGTDVGGVVLSFTDRTTELSGTVTQTGNATAAAATVIVFPTDRDGWINYGTSPRRLRNVRADKTGAFSIGNLPPGEYFVAAILETAAAQWQDPRFLESLASRASRVTLGEGQKLTQSLQVVR